MEEGPESGAVRWASGAEILESGAGGGWESDAGLRKQRQTTQPFQKKVCVTSLYSMWTPACIHVCAVREILILQFTVILPALWRQFMGGPLFLNFTSF